MSACIVDNRAAQAPITAIEVPAVATASTPAADAAPTIAPAGEVWPLRCPVRYCQSRNVSAIGSKAGEVVLILEAMKMENEVIAMHDGTVAQILVSKGSSVSTGAILWSRLARGRNRHVVEDNGKSVDQFRLCHS